MRGVGECEHGRSNAEMRHFCCDAAGHIILGLPVDGRNNINGALIVSRQNASSTGTAHASSIYCTTDERVALLRAIRSSFACVRVRERASEIDWLRI